MDTLPNEIYLQILSYLDIDNCGFRLDTVALLKSFPREFTVNEVCQLFKLRFPEYFIQSLYTDDNIGFIHLDLLNLKSALDLSRNFKCCWYTCDSNTCLNITWLHYEDIGYNINIYKHGIKYLILNDIIWVDQIDAAYIKDTDLCDYFKFKSIYEFDFDKYICNCVDVDNKIVVNHILKNKLFDPDTIVNIFKTYIKSC